MAELITTDRDQAFTLWLGVLRDPKSEKMCGALAHHFHTDQRCCLGHACHALGEERALVKEYGVLGVGHVAYGPEKEIHTLPDRVARLLNLTCEGEFKALVVVGGAEFDTLSDLNDASNLTPAEIADVIEDMWKNDGFVPYAEDEYDD